MLVAEAALRHWQSLAAVAALIEREAALIAERDALAERVKRLEGSLHDIRAAWLHEASQADGIMEEHVFTLGESDRVLPRAEARNG